MKKNLFKSVLCRDYSGVLAALRNGEDPNLFDSTTQTFALHIAAFNGDIEILRLLLDYGADPSLKDGRSETAAEFTLRGISRNVVRDLSQMFEAVSILAPISNSYDLPRFGLHKSSLSLNVN
ncbi:ankyrin repeat domain-containing protein [Stappia indica]|jgi:ankyrin repeat protein|uniref:ankyrin repeat domain-containing protein n=1 Tax=Stappia indica TaxID=538381 RepID=UPI0009F1C839